MAVKYLRNEVKLYKYAEEIYRDGDAIREKWRRICYVLRFYHGSQGIFKKFPWAAHFTRRYVSEKHYGGLLVVGDKLSRPYKQNFVNIQVIRIFHQKDSPTRTSQAVLLHQDKSSDISRTERGK